MSAQPQELTGELITDSEMMPEATKTGMQKMQRVEAGLQALKEAHAADPDCSTDEGYADAKAKAREVARVRLDVEKAHKPAKQFYLEGGRRIDAMRRSILAVTDPIEAKYKDAMKAVDDERERIAREAAEAEQLRIEKIEVLIGRIKATPAASVNLEQVNAALQWLASIGQTAAFDEFESAGRNAIAHALNELTSRRNDLIEQQAEAERLEAVRREQVAAQAKLDAERAAFEAEKQRAKDEAEAAERKARQEAEAVEREKAAAEAARVKAIEDERKRVQAEADKKAAEEAEAARRAAMAPDADKLGEWMRESTLLPAMTTDEGRRVMEVIEKHLDVIETVVRRFVADSENVRSAE